jgi:hypothetical protein
VAVASHLYDGQHPVNFDIKPDMAIDTFATLPDGRPNPNHGNLYEVWSRYYADGQYPGNPNSVGGSDLMLAVSRDAGQTWQIQLEPDPAGGSVPVTAVTPDMPSEYSPGRGLVNSSHITIGPEGDIYVCFVGNLEVNLAHSTDGGHSFTHPDEATNTLIPFGAYNTILPSPNLSPNPDSPNHFRTYSVRAVAADPTRPGYVYVAEGAQINDPYGNPLDAGDVIFARSTDYGQTWQTTFQVGPTAAANVLNDDNGGRSATGLSTDVTSGQVWPRLATGAQGDLAVIWYDTRHDLANHALDVYGTVSSDGGRTFSPNFRVTSASFDANAFTDANGNTDYYLGDNIGLTLANRTAYAAWTDTRNGNQDVYFARYPLSPPPAAANDRFEPNDTPATATDLGPVFGRDLSRLAIAPGDEDWFRVQAAASGHLMVTATLAAPGDSVRLELRDAGGATLLATGTALVGAGGQVIGQAVTFPCVSGQNFLVRVLPGPDAAAAAPALYTLGVRALTADLGARVYGLESGHLVAGDNAYYALTAGAPGSLEVRLTPGANTRGTSALSCSTPTTWQLL